MEEVQVDLKVEQKVVVQHTSRKASKASKSRTGRSRSQCDIRTKIDISLLTNQNLVKDDLATVAYFVQGNKGKINGSNQNKS